MFDNERAGNRGLDYISETPPDGDESNIIQAGRRTILSAAEP